MFMPGAVSPRFGSTASRISIEFGRQNFAWPPVLTLAANAA
jgi:hypothetical protein